jgi:hypothetical protein
MLSGFTVLAPKSLPESYAMRRKSVLITVLGIFVALNVRTAVWAQAPQVVTIRAGRLFDPKSGTNLTNQVGLVSGDRITEVGPAANVRVPADAKVIPPLGRACLQEPKASSCAVEASKFVEDGKEGTVAETFSYPAGAILDNWSQQEWNNGVQIDQMEELESLAIRTQNSIYEITILSGRSGEVLVRGGQFFSEFTPARLSGSTLGGSFLKMRGIYVGLRMEINVNGQRIVTSPVESIGVVV